MTSLAPPCRRSPVPLVTAVLPAHPGSETGEVSQERYSDRSLFVSEGNRTELGLVMLRVVDPQSLLSNELLEKIAAAAASLHQERKFPLEANCDLVNGELCRQLTGKFPGSVDTAALLYCEDVTNKRSAEEGVRYVDHFVANFRAGNVFVAADATYPIHRMAPGDLRGKGAQAVVFAASSGDGLKNILTERLGGMAWEARPVPPEQLFHDLEKIKLLPDNSCKAELVASSDIETLSPIEQKRFTMQSSDPLAVEETTEPSKQRQFALGLDDWEGTAFYRSVIKKEGRSFVMIERVNARELLKHVEICPTLTLGLIADMTRFQYEDPLQCPGLPNACRLIALQAHRSIVTQMKEGFTVPYRHANRAQALRLLESAEQSQRYLVEHRAAPAESLNQFDALRKQSREFVYRESGWETFRNALGRIFSRWVE